MCFSHYKTLEVGASSNISIKNNKTVATTWRVFHRNPLKIVKPHSHNRLKTKSGKLKFLTVNGDESFVSNFRHNFFFISQYFLPQTQGIRSVLFHNALMDFNVE